MCKEVEVGDPLAEPVGLLYGQVEPFLFGFLGVLRVPRICNDQIIVRPVLVSRALLAGAALFATGLVTLDYLASGEEMDRNLGLSKFEIVDINGRLLLFELVFPAEV